MRRYHILGGTLSVGKAVFTKKYHCTVFTFSILNVQLPELVKKKYKQLK